ncbi:uncharacterized protein si:ch73-52p7.1 [Trichomycterus rosablanca]|uniref:uncharacterized protein si:ch73-52p7.1 n=1 Tax=Trichomycterus rosablanca TaxID=2290929 RepID=UPI002F35C88F
MGCIALLSVLCLVMPVLLRAEFTLVNVREHSLYICTCMQDLVACSVINSSECDCDNHADNPHVVTYKRLTVWYTSPFNVARLLNNSEIRHLILAKCDSTSGTPPSLDYFIVKRLERLTILYPFWTPGQNYDIVLGREMGVLYHEEPRIAVIHTVVLTGKVGLKAYTVKTKVDSNGMIPFPYVFVSLDGLPEMSNISVTFLY